MEIIIVIALIAIIMSVVVLNYQGGLEKGKAFKTKMAMERVETILNLKMAEDPKASENITSQWDKFVEESPLIKNPNDFINDAWGKKFDVEYSDGIIKISSTNYEEYLRRTGEKKTK